LLSLLHGYFANFEKDCDVQVANKVNTTENCLTSKFQGAYAYIHNNLCLKNFNCQQVLISRMKNAFSTPKNVLAKGISNYYNLGFEFFERPCPNPLVEEDQIINDNLVLPTPEDIYITLNTVRSSIFLIVCSGNKSNRIKY
jgi:hypothetical protein